MGSLSSAASLRDACKGLHYDETWLVCSEWLASQISSESHLHRKHGKFQVRRSFPRNGATDLLWTVRDCDGTDFGSQPCLVEQAKRLLFRAKAMRDLQTMLMTHSGAGASFQQVQQAFYLMCWLIPYTEEVMALPSMLVSQLCNKDQGRPLKGFSDVSAYTVWAEIPSILRTTILNWMDGKYIAEAGARGYQLCEHDTVQASYQHQQIEAWGEMSLELMHEALQKLEARAHKDSMVARSTMITVENFTEAQHPLLQHVLRRLKK